MASLLDKEDKIHGSKAYTEEILEIFKGMPAEGFYHIREMTNILKILSNFDYQKSERMMLNILRERWRHTLTCIIDNGNRNRVESDPVKSHTRG